LDVRLWKIDYKERFLRALGIFSRQVSLGVNVDIKVWMLTGDKLETAENIGYSCKLIQQDFEKLYIGENDDLEQKYNEHSQNIKRLKEQKKRICLLVEGKAISTISII
jgi:phospholipid-translocating ATPase